MTLLYCVRHGETDWNRERRWQGHTDRHLNDEGRAHAAAAAEALAAVPFASIISSDLRRSLDTAAPLAARLDLPVRTEVGLREVDVGSWAGLTREQAFARDPRGARRHAAGRTGWTDGETYEQMMARAADAATRIADAHDQTDRVAVFTHGGVIRGLAAHVLGIDSATARRQLRAVAHVSLTVVRVPRTGQDRPWQLARYNHHLVELALSPDDVT
jgi:broad specificity phosphatase PhoE